MRLLVTSQVPTVPAITVMTAVAVGPEEREAAHICSLSFSTGQVTEAARPRPRHLLPQISRCTENHLWRWTDRAMPVSTKSPPAAGLSIIGRVWLLMGSFEMLRQSIGIGEGQETDSTLKLATSMTAQQVSTTVCCPCEESATFATLAPSS